MCFLVCRETIKARWVFVPVRGAGFGWIIDSTRPFVSFVDPVGPARGDVAGRKALGLPGQGARRSAQCGSHYRQAHVMGDLAQSLARRGRGIRSEEHTSELQSLMRISYAVFCLKKKK